jgi:hypothetical protein
VTKDFQAPRCIAPPDGTASSIVCLSGADFFPPAVTGRRVRGDAGASWKALVEDCEFDATYLQADLKPNERMRIVDLAE